MGRENKTTLGRVSIVHPHRWLWEPLEAEPSFVLRTMFGAKAVYLHGRLVLAFVARQEPWRGILVCTERAHHPSLIDSFPALSSHPILPKWLYLAEAADHFEAIAEKLVGLALRRDPRMGIEPPPAKPRRRG